MKHLFTVFFVVFLCVTGISAKANSDTLTIAFWNVENLYNSLNDTMVIDEEFLPESEKNWNIERIAQKTANLTSIISLMTNGKGPDVLGVAEIENLGVLEDWNSRDLKAFNYGIVHEESPDLRGIDVGMFYNKSALELLTSSADTVFLGENRSTRLILHAAFTTKSGDTLHFFVNHWPSRRGGQDESEKGRIAAAAALRKMMERVLSVSPSAKLLCMGDFNDEPENISITQTLNALDFDCPNPSTGFLNNLAAAPKKAGIGSLKYRDQWNLIDQMMISNSLLQGSGYQYLCNSFTVFKDDKMIQKEGRYAGSPMPTFGGRNYLGGYSDHLPVYCKFILR